MSQTTFLLVIGLSLDPTNQLGHIGSTIIWLNFFYKKNINNAWMFLLYVPKKINLTYSAAQVNDLIKMY